MDVENVSPQFEQEVSEISLEIEERRNKLEKDAGIESHEQVAREVIGAAIAAAAAKGAQPANDVPEGASYLDTTDTDTAHAVNKLIGRIHEKGLSAAIAEARSQSPYILDAFHDALVEKLYDTLKTANYI